MLDTSYARYAINLLDTVDFLSDGIKAILCHNDTKQYNEQELVRSTHLLRRRHARTTKQCMRGLEP